MEAVVWDGGHAVPGTFSEVRVSEDLFDGVGVGDGDFVVGEADEVAVFFVEGDELGVLVAFEDVADVPEAGDGGEGWAGDGGEGVEEAAVEDDGCEGCEDDLDG